MLLYAIAFIILGGGILMLINAIANIRGFLVRNLIGALIALLFIALGIVLFVKPDRILGVFGLGG